MSKIAFVFPGQGTQYAGMGEKFYNSLDENNKKILMEILKKIGKDVEDVFFNGNDEELKNTKYAQPTIGIISVMLSKILMNKGIIPDYVAGHSLGEYSALFSAGFLTEEDTIKLIAKRGEIMAENVVDGSMAAILGLDSKKVEEICNEVDGVLEAVNYNEPKQTVVAGERKLLEDSLSLFKENGAKRAIPLAVSGPFHSSLMKPVGSLLMKEFKNYSWSDSKIPLIANTTALDVIGVEDIQNELYNQTFGPVKWVDTINSLAEKGVTKIYELGPGKVLAGLIKKINKEMEVINIETLENLL